MTKIRFHFIAIFFIQLLCASGGKAQKAITPATALQHYLDNGDQSFQWKLVDSFAVQDIKGYQLLVTSQKWRESLWTHQLTILVPKENKYDGALLFITGGSNKEGQPKWNGKDDALLQGLSRLASTNKAIVSILRQTPNQPLYGDLTEDALISYTLQKFKKDGDYSWPLLFPMVKSAVRAMDAVEEFSKRTLQHTISRFVVSGASKRGWTTWLTGAHDKRVTAIAPMVIDVLNMPVNLDYQVKVWKKYSEQIEDYVKLGIPQDVHTENGDAITQMVDPYSYRKKLTMPKLIIMGTNDEYWPVDAIKHYYDGIPGQNLIHYVPNAGHDLGDKKQALQALSAFFGNTLMKNKYPVCTWDVSSDKEGVTLSVKASPDELVDAILWSADSDDTDFRDEKWEGKSLGVQKQSRIVATQHFPGSGFQAFYLDLKYRAPNGGEYTESTRMFVTDDDEVFIK